MPVCEIRVSEYRKKIGTLAVSTAKNAKKHEIEKVVIYSDWSDTTQRMIAVDVGRMMGGNTVLTITQNAALEMVKGLLQNIPYFFVAADNELQAILKEKMAEAERDAEGIRDVLQDRNPR